MKEIYIPCDCGTEVLRIELDDETKEYFIGIYQFKKGYTIRDKLRYIWRIIKTGEPYGDQIVINKDKMEELIGFIKEKKQ